MSPARALDPKLFDETIAAVALFAGAEHRLLYTNAALKRMLGARTLGLPAAQAFPEKDAEEFLTVLDDVRATGRARQLNDSREPDPGAFGQAKYFVYSCTPVTTPQGDGALVVLMDTTAETRALQRYEALVSAVSQMVWVLRADGTMDEIVAGWQDLTGTPWPGRTGEDLFARIHPRDREMLSRAWHDALGSDDPEMVAATFRIRTPDGAYRHVSTRAVPVVSGGRIDEWIAATADVEAGWGAQLRERLLAAVGAVSGGTLDEAFAAVVDVIVPELADACLILLLSHEEWPLPENARVTARRVASRTRPGLLPPPALRGQRVALSDTVRDVLEKGVPRTFYLPDGGAPPAELVPTVTEEWLAATDATSLTLIPLVVDDLVLGYAATSTNGDTPVPAANDVALLREVLHHAQRPIRKVLDLQQARRTALALQRAHLTRPPEVPGASLAAVYRPASSAGEIGGDWYDAFLQPDGTLVLDIGDVAGHDLAAATAMGQLRSMLRALAWNKGPECLPASVLSLLDDVAEGLHVAPFTTAVHSHLRRLADGHWQLTWSNAGHPPPLLVPVHDAPRFLTGAGEDLPLSVDPRVARTTHTHLLGPGDTVVLYTDGLIETPTAALDEGQARLVREAARHRGTDLPELLRHLNELSDCRDDTAMIAFRADRQ
ncbi:SpoIIE family protein phosphatase [Streptomyces sp. SID14478]|uniref:SpoIIE family protein phosphatase n=1 Tax=Streptomyces sp. SID14478 TaxID=2706073 RepID=UPI0013DA188C|nr:SpoIIE family protein phosphatase [Streptomyces sp. SID14478]NEB80036.1 SpoIIE family protein phosphatase [Streptomyces sp. SID14478]